MCLIVHCAIGYLNGDPCKNCLQNFTHVNTCTHVHSLIWRKTGRQKTSKKWRLPTILLWLKWSGKYFAEKKNWNCGLLLPIYDTAPLLVLHISVATQSFKLKTNVSGQGTFVVFSTDLWGRLLLVNSADRALQPNPSAFVSFLRQRELWLWKRATRTLETLDFTARVSWTENFARSWMKESVMVLATATNQPCARNALTNDTGNEAKFCAQLDSKLHNLVFCENNFQFVWSLCLKQTNHLTSQAELQTKTCRRFGVWNPIDTKNYFSQILSPNIEDQNTDLPNERKPAEHRREAVSGSTPNWSQISTLRCLKALDVNLDRCWLSFPGTSCHLLFPNFVISLLSFVFCTLGKLLQQISMCCLLL